MKDKLLKILKSKQERKQTLGKKAKETESIEELRSINAELEVLNEEIEELRNVINEIPDDTAEGEGNGGEGEGEKREEGEGNEGEKRNQPIGEAQILGTYGINPTPQAQRSADRYDTPEYRNAFMSYVVKNEKSDELEFRADATTGVGDVGAVIPTTIMNKIIEKLNTYGMIWNRVTKTSFRGGLDIPISNLKPVATWVASGVSEKQKKTASDTVNFKYHKLQCRVAVDLVADTVSLPIFEQTITDNIYEAMIMALEEGIINGTGSGQPLGITEDTGIPAEQKIEVAVADAGKFNTWTDIVSNIPLAYESRVAIIMTKVDWDKYILGMTDSNGQPVGRVNYGIDGRISRKLLGYDVILVEGYLPTIDAAETAATWGIICDLKEYIVNSNLQMTYKRYFDENTDEWISKSTLIADGKLGDKQGVLLLTKKATV